MQGAVPEGAAAERLDQLLTAAMQRYLLHLHSGRVDPRQVHHNFALPRQDEFDPATVLLAALAARRLDQAEQAAVPRLPLYERLRAALARYRALVDHAAWRQPLPPLPRPPRSRVGKLEPGQPYDGLALLAQRLVALGDLADARAALPPLPPTAPVYEGALVDAVKGFQQRHGLTGDGVIGAATLKQLQVTPAARVRQIELTMERLRWTPLLQGPRMIVINVPEFVLRAYEVEDGRIGVRQTMKVIVGKAMDTRTPLFDEDMRFIEFSPYWNVPPSIARSETGAAAAARRGLFRRARASSSWLPDGRVGTTLSPARSTPCWPAAAHPAAAGAAECPGRHQVRVPEPRQHLPASHPGHAAVRPRSARLQPRLHPRRATGGAGRFLLRGMPEWTEERIRQAMAPGLFATLRLTEPVRVLITYGTALVKGGRTYFYDDIYGHDRLLDAALRRRAVDARPSPRP